MLSVGQQQCCGQQTQAYIACITWQVTFLSTESSGTRADCCFFHWSWVWLLFKAALESADMSHSSWTAVRVTKSPREGWPPRVAGISRKDPASMWSGCVVHVNVWPCGGLEGRHPGKMMHCWTHWRKFWLLWRFFKYYCLGSFISEPSVVRLCFYSFSLSCQSTIHLFGLT